MQILITLLVTLAAVLLAFPFSKLYKFVARKLATPSKVPEGKIDRLLSPLAEIIAQLMAFLWPALLYLLVDITYSPALLQWPSQTALVATVFYFLRLGICVLLFSSFVVVFFPMFKEKYLQKDTSELIADTEPLTPEPKESESETPNEAQTK